MSSISEQPVHPAPAGPPVAPPEGFVMLGGSEMYRIPDYDCIAPFLMTVTSDADLWMYLSSSGGLTAGRIDADHAIFPYETEDQLHRLYGITGPITLLKIDRAQGPAAAWEPFSPVPSEGVSRNLYKNVLGNHVVFEAQHHVLRVTCRYSWQTSDRFGFVRTVTLSNDSPDQPLTVDVLDGLLNVLPAGVFLATQQQWPVLADAYKRSEWDEAGRLAMFSMTSLVTDRAEPAESLAATVVWSRGLAGATVALSESAVAGFRHHPVCGGDSNGTSAHPPPVHGERGAFLLSARLSLAPGSQHSWDTVLDAQQDHVKIASLRRLLREMSEDAVRREVQQAAAASEAKLLRLVGSADGLQCSADRLSTAHHAANALFNCMRGGLPLDGYTALRDDFGVFVHSRNSSVRLRYDNFFHDLPATLTVTELIAYAEQYGVSDLPRLAHEYLPLTFGRRHGDPSRPWNRFAIRLRNPDGSRRIGYEGNWRDIFQNWEALAISFPALLESFIGKFVNASTIDGFNPYRISSEGIDWEEQPAGDRWSNLGYWGDHQIAYLLRLLELSRQFHPGRLQRLLTRAIFSYANVPYRLRAYRTMLRDPRNTIIFDHDAAKAIEAQVKSIGADGRLLLDPQNKVYPVTLLEKLLVPLLCKLSNFVPGGGIWMNTQRPEWNDANNALAGYGLSVVTLCYLRRYVRFLLDLLQPLADKEFRLTAAVAEWGAAVGAALRTHAPLLDQPAVRDTDRRALMDDLGEAFDVYRRSVYDVELGRKKLGRIGGVVELLELAERYLDHSLRANRRPDGLFHSYNLLDLTLGERLAGVKHLDEMLEGQVAALSSGQLAAAESVNLLEAMFHSRLARPEQNSFMLYPLRTLPSFLQRNAVAAEQVAANPLLAALAASGDATVISRDADGIFRFSASFTNARHLEQALSRIGRSGRFQSLVEAHAGDVLRLYEQVFQHHRFTGRSGAMFAYEGIGSVYWHMIGKLLLAVQECFWAAVDGAEGGQSDAAAATLASAYYRIRAGLGFNKRAREFGAFPIDPYSHTPAAGGARQPGMTGEVKEEILTRLGEWGLRVREGRIHFDPRLLRRQELLEQPAEFTYIDLHGQNRRIELPSGSAAFTFCQVLVVYRLGELAIAVAVQRADGRSKITDGASLDAATSTAVFQRTGAIERIEVSIPQSILIPAAD